VVVCCVLSYVGFRHVLVYVDEGSFGREIGSFFVFFLVFCCFLYLALFSVVCCVKKFLGSLFEWAILFVFLGWGLFRVGFTCVMRVFDVVESDVRCC